MKVVIHPGDQGGCGSYRLIWPGQALKDQGYDVTVDYDAKYRGVFRSTIQGETLINLDQKVHADVVVIQRPLHRHRFELIQILQRKGVAVVVEVDDDFHAIHKRNAAWQGTKLLANRDHHRDWLMKSCEIADLVTVTTPALAKRYGAHGRVAVVPNCIPERYLGIGVGSAPPAPSRSPVVGWSGSVATHPGDLEVTDGALAQFTISIVGTGKGVKTALGLDYKPASTGWLPIDEYPQALANFDIGIVPLQLSPFNEAKSALKGLEFAAVGVPFIASPTGPYEELHKQGAGLLARTPAEWKNTVKRLLKHPLERNDLIKAGRKVAAKSTIEENCWRWYQAYQWAMLQRKKAA